MQPDWDLNKERSIMDIRTVLQVTLLLTVIRITGTVNYTVIGGIRGGNVFECGTTVILRCNALPMSALIRWQINYTLVTTTDLAAECFGSPCTIINSFSGRYNFTYEQTSGISDLIISAVASEDNKRHYLCDDLGTTSSFEASVKLFVRNETATMDTLNSTGTYTLLVTTGCAILTGNITFDWFKVNANNNDRTWITTEFYKDYTNCTIYGACSGKSFISSLQINEFGLGYPGEKYYIQCVVNVTDDDSPGPVILLSDRTFTAKEMTPIHPPQKSGLTKRVKIIIGVVVPVGIIVLLLGAVGLWCFLHRRNKAMDAPETPAGFELVRDSVAENSATFRCRPKPYAPGKQEIVLLCHQQGTDNHKAEKTLTVSDPAPLPVYLRIDSLKIGCVYACNVFSRSNKRQSATSNKIIIKTLGLPDKPTDLKVVKVETNSIQLSWIPGRYRMNEQRFILELQNMKSGDETVDIITTAKDSPFSHTVESLPAGTKFSISLHAKNDVGASGCVGPIEVTTSGNPDPPSELKETAVTPSSITICWKPGGYRRHTQSFVIEYGRAKKNFENISWKQKTKDDDLQPLITYKLDKLRPGTKYAIVIFARNDIGMSYRTEPLLVITKENNHGDLRELRI